MRATLHPCAPFQHLVAAAKELVAEAAVECNANGWFFSAMDSSHVCLCRFRLAPSLFAVYTCEEPMTIGLNLVLLDKLLRCAQPDDVLSLEVTTDNTNVLVLTFHPDGVSNSAPPRKTQFEMNLMDILADELGVPDTETHHARVEMPSAQLQHICKDLRIVGDTCTIRCSGRTVGMGVEGNVGKGLCVLEGRGTAEAEAEATEADADADDTDAVDVTTTAPVCQTFALRYLLLFTKFAPLAPRVHLSLTQDGPLMVHYAVGGAADMSSWVRLYLAPKVDEA